MHLLPYLLTSTYKQVYSEDNRGEFPSNLSKLSKVISEYVGYKNFTPEAAIVNYYNMDSTLGGHTDHSEKNCQAPLFSFRQEIVSHTHHQVLCHE